MTSSFLVGDFPADRSRTGGPGGPGDLDAAATPTRSNALPPGTRLDEYELGPLLSESPLGLVYLATDHSLGRRVAIREYLPLALSGRGEGPLVALRSAGMSDAYRRGLRAFIEEARLLAQFDDPSLLSVLRFWEAHFTAYIVMPYYEAPTLTTARERLDAPPAEPWIRSLLESLANALELLHEESCLHRNVTPDRILMLRDGRPMLLGPSAVRQVLGREAHTTPIQPGFSAIEEYAESSDLPQGPWTDVYALGALARFCILGIAPVAATVRSVRDPLVGMQDALFPLRVQWPTLEYSPSLLHAIDRALAVDPAQRPQSMSELRQLLRDPRVAALHDPRDVRDAPEPWADADAAHAGAGTSASSAIDSIFDPTRPEPDLNLLSTTDLETADFAANLSAMVDEALVDAPPMRTDHGALARGAPRVPADPSPNGDSSDLPSSTSPRSPGAGGSTVERAAAAVSPRLPFDDHEPTLDLDAPIEPARADPPFDATADDRIGRAADRLPLAVRPSHRRSWTGVAALLLLGAFGYVGWTQYQRHEKDDQIASRVQMNALPEDSSTPSSASTSAPATESPAASTTSPDMVAEAGLHPPAAGASPSPAAVPTPAADPAPAAAPDIVSTPEPAPATESSAEPTSVPPPAHASESRPLRSARLARAAQREAHEQSLHATPRAICGSRVDFALYRCMTTQCDKPQFVGHAQCRQFKLENKGE